MLILVVVDAADWGPSYQNVFRVAVWLFFLGVYSQAGSCTSV